MKRTADNALVGKPSPFHSGVTLFESGPSTPRRSKRLKTEPDAESQSLFATEEVKKTTVGKKRGPRIKVEQAEPALEVETKPARKSASPRKPKPVPQALEVPHPAPHKWKEQYYTIKTMREHIVAPVDTMGCEQAQLKEVDPRVRLINGQLKAY